MNKVQNCGGCAFFQEDPDDVIDEKYFVRGLCDYHKKKTFACSGENCKEHTPKLTDTFKEGHD